MTLASQEEDPLDRDCTAPIHWPLPKGREAQDVYRQRLDIIEEHWQTRFGQDNIRKLRTSLEHLVGESTAQPSSLLKGLKP